MINRKSIGSFLLFIIFSFNLHANLPFCKSFVQYYELGNEGRFTHEYHPYLLKKTAQSFNELESSLQKTGFKTSARIILMGYEKAAAPDYFFNPFAIKGDAINDESITKTLFGQTKQMHNCFGFMTGFLFRSMPSHADLVTHHVGNKQIILFDSRAVLFQKDFFGSLYPFLKEQEQKTYDALLKKNHALCMQTCIDFWKTLYLYNNSHENNQNNGTQDILFSIEHAQHIKDSPIPLRAFFTGSDITYPINQTSLKSKKATENAQKFVKTMAQHLKPINNEKTIYVFRSFVDGVGKSTMLGNIKNWMAHGDHVEQYEQIDNASSQTAEIFPFSDSVFIADLPAQLSHFTYKPDGSVFVNIKNLIEPIQSAEEVLAFYEQNRELIHKNFIETIHSIKEIPDAISDDLYQEYCNNLLLLEVTNLEYIPFMYQNKTYLIAHETKELRVAVPLEDAPSEGLKNSYPEQMIFHTGIRFPYAYQHFLDTFIDQCKKTGASQIVFVDFLSMYARSSRESIRINYLIQQIKRIFHHADHNDSFYGGFVSNAALLYKLNQIENFKKITQYFLYETLVRSTLFDAIDQQLFLDIKPIPFDTVTTLIKKEIKKTSEHDLKNIEQIIHKKVSATHTILFDQYKDDKEFVHILSADPTQLLSLSKTVENHLCKIQLAHKNPWHNLGTSVEEKELCTTGKQSRLVTMNTNQTMQTLWVFDPKSLDSHERAELFSLLRQWWIPTLISTLSVEPDQQGVPCTKKFLYPLAPVVIKEGLNGLWYVLQRPLERADDNANISEIGTINSSLLNPIDRQKIMYGLHDSAWYIKSWKASDTASGLFNLGFYTGLLQYSQDYPLMLDYAFIELIKETMDTLAPQKTVPISKIYQAVKKADQYSFFTFCQKELLKKSKQKQNDQAKTTPHHAQKKVAIIELPQQMYPWIKETSWILASVLQKVPHHDSPFAIPTHDVKSFYGLLMLIQQIILPQYAHRICTQPLWNDHEVANKIEYLKVHAS